MNPQGLLMSQKRLIKFEKVIDKVTQLHDTNFNDKVIDLKEVGIKRAGNDKHPDIHLDVPGLGVLTMTDWSKGQLGSMLGINWNKWFNPKVIKPAEMQEEMRRRFARTGQSSKLRARKFPKGAPGNKYADGFLRAALSPTYSAIDDVRIFDRLSKKFGGQMEDQSFMQNHLGSDFFNERASHYSVVGEPVNLGPIDRKHPDPRVRNIYDLAEKEGKLPDADWVYQGYHLRNSEVGFTAVTLDANVFRLVCLNGAVVTVKDGRLLYRMHRGIDDDGIDALLDGAFRKLPEVQEANKRRLINMQEGLLQDVSAEIEKFLGKQKASKTFTEQVKKAYEQEPIPNRYGVLQAITRAAQTETDMDKRFELEEMAGRYMAAA